MEKTMTRKNIFTYIADFARSIGSSAKTLFKVEEEEKVEGLEAFDEKKLNKEDAKILEALLESQKGAVADIEIDQERRNQAIDYPDKGKNFKKGIETQEIDEEEPREVQSKTRTSQGKERVDD